jgi:type II secretory pathway predicted ATPase ExeA
MWFAVWRKESRKRTRTASCGPKAQRQRLRTRNVHAKTTIRLKKKSFDNAKMCRFGRFGKLIEETEIFMLNDLPALKLFWKHEEERH